MDDKEREQLRVMLGLEIAKHERTKAELAAERENADRLAKALAAYPADYDLSHMIEDGYMVVFVPDARNEALQQHEARRKAG